MQILKKPVISEKSMMAVQENKYVFKVAPQANKHQIAESVAETFKVKVIKVNIINLHPEEKMTKGRFLAQTKAWKKAIVTIKKGQKISGFEIKE